MQLLPIFSFFLGVHSLAIEQRSCVSSDVIAVAQQVTNPHYFCAWYLSDGRTKSPIQNIDANTLLTACNCITSAEPAGANAKNLNAIANAARLQSFISATCPSTSGNPISKEFRDSSSFCSFFNSFERHDSPIPNLNVPAVRHACKCVLENPTTSTSKSSIKSAPTSTKKLSTRSSSTSSKKSSSKILSTLSIRSSSKPIVKSSSSETPTIKSSTSKVFSSESSSLSRSIANRTSSETSSGKTTASTSISSSTKSSSRALSSSKASSPNVSLSKISSSTKSSSKASSSKTSSVHPTSTVDAYNIITSNHLEAFCTTYLDYTIPSATITMTAFATTTKMNNSTLSTTSTITSVSTETDIIGTVTVLADEVMDKRSVATPAALLAYPESAISSGCSRAARLPATQTIVETITLTSIESIATTITTTAYETEASVATELATSTVTALTPVYTGEPCGTQPYGALWDGFAGRFDLYCNGYTIVGVATIKFLNVTTMTECLTECQAFNCAAVAVDDQSCQMYASVEYVQAASGHSAAIRAQ